MKMRPAWFLAASLTLALVAFAVACAGDEEPTSVPQPTATTAPTIAVPTEAPTEAPPAAGGTLTFALKELGPFSGHPRLTAGQQMVNVGLSSGELMVIVNDKSEYVPQLLQEWDVSTDGTIWTLKLKDGVQFHKGWGEMTAEDIIWNMQEYAADDSLSPRKGMVARLWANDAGYAKALDNYTVEVNTGTPQYDMLFPISSVISPIFSKKQVDELGEEAAMFDSAGTGPWEFVESSSGDFWKFKAVKDHWRQPPAFDELMMLEMPEESVRLANFQTGNADIFVVALDSLPAVKEVSGSHFIRITGGGTEHLGYYGNYYVGIGTDDQKPAYNPELPWVSASADVTSSEWEDARKVREAMSISIDRNLIVDELLSGEGEPLVLWGWEANMHRLPARLQSWDYDPDRARQLLEDAGYGDGFPVTVTPSIRGVAAEVEAAEAIATMWGDIGIDVTLNKVPYDVIGPKLATRAYQGLSVHGSARYFDPLAFTSVIFLSTGGWSAGFDHPTFDELLTKAIGTIDTDERFKILVKAAEFTYDNVLDAGLYTANAVWPLSARINASKDQWIENLNYSAANQLTGLEYARPAN